MMSEKKCSKCGGLKSASQFYRDASSATGLDSCCRECRRAYARSRPKRDCPSVESKICSHCCKVKPACEFGKNARESTGLQPWCRACHSAYVNNKPKVDAPVVSEKRCSKCGVIKPAGDFCKDKYKPSGLRSWCRQCRNVARAATRNESPRVETQKCRGCGEMKQASDFPKCKENASGLKSLCQACRSREGDALHKVRRPQEVCSSPPRGALKRKASNVDSAETCAGGQKLRNVSLGRAGETPTKRIEVGCVEPPFTFSIPTKRRSPRKGGGPSGNSPTSQWNNGAAVWSQVEDLWGAALVAQDGTPIGGQSGMVQNAALPDSIFTPSPFAVSPFSVALDQVKIEQLSPGPAYPCVGSSASTPGFWLEAFDGQVQCPVFVPGSIDLPIAASPVVPCMQVVVTGTDPHGHVETFPVPQSPPRDSPSGLQVLAEAAELVTSSPLEGGALIR